MANDTLHIEDANGIRRVAMSAGANALNPELMTALLSTLEGFRADGAPPVLLTSSHDHVFCPGWDLKYLVGADRDQVAASLELFNRLTFELFSYPGPTGAAIGGHAVAGGCLLALCCDLRIMAQGRPRIGLSELNLGVPVPMRSLLMLRRRLAPNIVDELVVSGDGCNAERGRELGYVHRVAEQGMEEAKTERELAKLASRPPRAFATIKRFLLGETWAAMEAVDPADDEAFLDCWFSPETQKRIEGMVQRLGT